jgi:hypothetical protein
MPWGWAATTVWLLCCLRAQRWLRLFSPLPPGQPCAPLNPAYRTNEFDASLAELRAKALIVQSGMDSPARAAAQARGIPIIELSPVLEAEAGLFTLSTGQHNFTPTGILPPPRADKGGYPPSPLAGEDRDGGAIQPAAYLWPTALSTARHEKVYKFT